MFEYDAASSGLSVVASRHLKYCVHTLQAYQAKQESLAILPERTSTPAATPLKSPGSPEVLHHHPPALFSGIHVFEQLYCLTI